MARLARTASIAKRQTRAATRAGAAAVPQPRVIRTGRGLDAGRAVAQLLAWVQDRCALPPSGIVDILVGPLESGYRLTLNKGCAFTRAAFYPDRQTMEAKVPADFARWARTAGAAARDTAALSVLLTWHDAAGTIRMQRVVAACDSVRATQPAAARVATGLSSALQRALQKQVAAVQRRLAQPARA